MDRLSRKDILWYITRSRFQNLKWQGWSKKSSFCPDLVFCPRWWQILSFQSLSALTKILTELYNKQTLLIFGSKTKFYTLLLKGACDLRSFKTWNVLNLYTISTFCLLFISFSERPFIQLSLHALENHTDKIKSHAGITRLLSYA